MTFSARQADPISRIVVSNKVGENDEVGLYNDHAVAQLFNNFKSIVNSNGEVAFGLTNLEEKVVKAGDAYVFLPIPKEIGHMKKPAKRELFQEIFKAASLVVGRQTKDSKMQLNENDPQSAHKPIVFINHDNCWDPFFELVEHMHKLGTIRAKPETLYSKVNDVNSAITLLKEAHTQKLQSIDHMPDTNEQVLTVEAAEAQQKDAQGTKQKDFNVCVFCSVSTKNQELIELSKNLGRQIAHEDWGMISGIGKSGMMGGVVEGASEVIKSEGKGWVGGSTLPRIVHIEGLPERYDQVWFKDDIYRRMEVMVEKSQAFVVLPGGMGTVQELMGMLLLRHSHDEQKPDLMKNKDGKPKPIILVNQTLNIDGKAEKFWQPMVAFAKKFGFEDDIIVVDTPEQAMDKLKEYHKTHPKATRLA